jgi:hypothetical protein
MKLGVGWGGSGIEHTIVRGGLHYTTGAWDPKNLHLSLVQSEKCGHFRFTLA